MRKIDNQNSLFDKHLVWRVMYPFCNVCHAGLDAQLYSAARFGSAYFCPDYWNSSAVFFSCFGKETDQDGSREQTTEGRGAARSCGSVGVWAKPLLKIKIPSGDSRG
jgi:hypothetical protein